MLQRNRKHQADLDAQELGPCQERSREEYEALALARTIGERKQQDEDFQKHLLYKESQRRKKEKRKSKIKAYDARWDKFNAKQDEFKAKKEARKARREAAKEERRKAHAIRKQAKAIEPSQEELAKQRRETKKKRKHAALEANPHAKEESERRNFGFRYFPTEKARARAQRQLLKNEVSLTTRRQQKEVLI